MDHKHAVNRAETTLSRSEEKYRDIVDNVLEGIAVFQDGRVRYINPKGSEITGFERAELQNRPFIDMVHPEDRGIVNAYHQRRMNNEESPPNYDVRIIHRSGEIRWMTLGIVLLEWDNLPAILCFFSDISEHKKLEEGLQQSILERESILQAAQVGISLTIDRVHQWVNRAFVELTGYDSADQLIGHSSIHQYPDETSWRKLGEESGPALARGENFTIETPIRCRNGELRWVRMYGARVSASAPEKGILWSVLDITERVQAEVEIREALEQQRELNLLKSRFVSMTSHEFRTPLAAILSSTELLRHYRERLPAEEQEDLFNNIEAAVTRMTQMLDNILTIGRAEADRLEFKPEPVNLHIFVESLAAEVSATIVENGRPVPEFVVAIDSSDLNFWLDEKLMRHILGNLLSNAFKYSPDGGVIEFFACFQDGRLTFSIKDQGIGIPANELPHLFESFHRANNVGHIPGTGLGLAIVKKAIDTHGGHINVDSEIGRGTRFTVSLPTQAGGLSHGQNSRH